MAVVRHSHADTTRRTCSPCTGVQAIGLVLALSWSSLADAAEPEATPEPAPTESTPEREPQYRTEAAIPVPGPHEPPGLHYLWSEDPTLTVTPQLRVPSPHDPGEPLSNAGLKIIKLEERMRRRVKQTRYQPQTFLDGETGTFYFDCSGMANWLIKRVSPQAFRAVDRERPVAVSYVRIIDRAWRSSYRDGWKKIERMEDVRPGDMFAWRRPDWFPEAAITGHVGFFLERPRKLDSIPGAWEARIVDSTSEPHKDDSRPIEGEGGWGTGTMLFFTNEQGDVIGYGWHGDESDELVETPIAIGRIQ